jgi:hypothetical protein
MVNKWLGKPFLRAIPRYRVEHTAKCEMRRHCRIYEEHFDTGIAVTPVD